MRMCPLEGSNDYIHALEELLGIVGGELIEVKSSNFCPLGYEGLDSWF